MPNFYFDIRTSTAIIRDTEGRTLQSLDAAIREAKQEALGLASDYLRFPDEACMPEAILLRDTGGIASVVNVADSVFEALRPMATRNRSGLAIVAAADEGERFAATVAFQHRGYLVHQAENIEAAACQLKIMGKAHPLLWERRPVVFAALDESEPPVRVLKEAHSYCPNLWSLVASNAPSTVVYLPRRFTTRELEDFLPSTAI